MKRFGFLMAVFLAFTMPAHAADPALSLEANSAYLAAYAKKPGVFQRPSGLMYRIIRNGVGMRPGPLDTVSVYYKGSMINGKQFDATEPGFPISFKVNGVIPGWTEALENMRVGDHWELVIPANIAYGTRGANGVIPPNQTLIFDLELLDAKPPSKEEQQQDEDQQSQH